MDANTVTVLRNPKGPLNEIRRVTNPEPAAGGADLEETALVKQRGPYSLKNRGRAIAPEDYEWLGREVAGARRVYCLPTRKSNGTRMPGWVTVVVVPEATHTLTGGQGRTEPEPTLLREVREYLAARALANLAGPSLEAAAAADSQPDLDQIHVKGATVVEVVVHAKVTPKDRQKSDSTRQDVLKQLAAFLYPVDGGPDRQGWQPGRERVSIGNQDGDRERAGGRSVGEIWLTTPSRQQQSLTPAAGTRLAVSMPVGSQVSTFDERIKGLLLSQLPANTNLDSILVGGFNDNDVVVVGPLQDDAPVVRRINLARRKSGEAASDPAIANEFVFDLPVDFPDQQTFDDWSAGCTGTGLSLASENGRVAAPIDASNGFRYEKDASAASTCSGCAWSALRPASRSAWWTLSAAAAAPTSFRSETCRPTSS